MIENGVKESKENIIEEETKNPIKLCVVMLPCLAHT